MAPKPDEPSETGINFEVSEQTENKDKIKAVDADEVCKVTAIHETLR